jgi:hypothetical protein
MKKIIDRYLFIISTNLKLPKIQFFSRNQSSYRFIISKKEQQAKFALLTLVKEELPNREYKVEFNMSFLHSLQSEVNHYFLTEIYLDQPSVYHTYNAADFFIQRKKIILVKKYFFPNN